MRSADNQCWYECRATKEGTSSERLDWSRAVRRLNTSEDMHGEFGSEPRRHLEVKIFDEGRQGKLVSRGFDREGDWRQCVASLAVALTECKRKVEAEASDANTTSFEHEDVGGAVQVISSVCLNSRSRLASS